MAAPADFVCLRLYRWTPTERIHLNTIALLGKPFQIDHFTAKVEELLRSPEKTV